jgi:3-oxoacyl-[acyl-carrier protein] reductase
MLSNSLRAAVTGFARTLADETAAGGVTVNCVMPGYIRTERLEGLIQAAAARGNTEPEAVRAAWTAAIPIGRIGTVRELADVVLFLASERASYLTGQAIAVDGGVVKSLF